MGSSKIKICLLLYVTASIAIADDSCAKLSKSLSKLYERNTVCQCGNELKNLIVSLPKGIKVHAVCGLKNNQGTVDLRIQKAFLDNYSSSGNYYQGDIYLSGNLVISGNVTASPEEDSPEFTFAPDKPILSNKTVFSNYLHNFAVDGEVFNAPMNLGTNSSECWIAKSVVRISGLKVSFFDSGYTEPLGLKVLKLSKYKKCK